MTDLRLVLGERLNNELASLRDISKETDIVLMAEVDAELICVKHHRRKIAILSSAMPGCAEALRDDLFLMVYRSRDRMDETKFAAIRHDADPFLDSLPEA